MDINIRLEEFKGHQMLVIEEVQEEKSKFRPRFIQFGRTKAKLIMAAEKAVKLFAEGIDPITGEKLQAKKPTEGVPSRPKVDTSAELEPPAA